MSKEFTVSFYMLSHHFRSLNRRTLREDVVPWWVPKRCLTVAWCKEIRISTRFPIFHTYVQGKLKSLTGPLSLVQPDVLKCYHHVLMQLSSSCILCTLFISLPPLFSFSNFSGNADGPLHHLEHGGQLLRNPGELNHFAWHLRLTNPIGSNQSQSPTEL